MITIWDPETDETREATQADVDKLLNVINKLVMATHPLPQSLAEVPDMPKRLAVYPNEMRPGRAFVAEEKEIEPYPDTASWRKPLYPAVPFTDFMCGRDLRMDFAEELVRRWNTYKPT